MIFLYIFLIIYTLDAYIRLLKLQHQAFLSLNQPCSFSGYLFTAS